ncbi:MAG: NADH-quinone oxidoreductase subunit NuoH [Candidatus Aminicenantes bacterium]|nr:MAG: NADH-quinone oxidoreductase subunit NuoH [Candidatus Aminicenantes bacterium]
MIEILIVFIKIVCALVWFLLLTLYLTWLERKESAVIQDRIGANRASIFGIRILGLFQPFADAIKMIFKEDFVPAFSRKFLHTLAPFISFFFVAITISAIPFGDSIRIGERTISLQILDFNVGLLFILAMLSLGIYGIILSGWASNNRYTLIGGLRGTAQLISYEVALGLSLIGLIMVFPSLKLSAIVHYQGELIFGFLPKWGIFLQPLGFLVFLFAALAETKRAPFDLPEAESEIIGFFAEYGGLKWGLFMMTDFMEIIVVSTLLTTLFFGGWQVPWMAADGFHWPWGGEWLLSHWLVVVFQVAAFNIKVFFFCWLQILIRWTYPRFRYDQLMDMGWKLLIPLSLVNIVGTGIVMSIL